jgi:RNA polymerase sigma-70 factor, ECF subfamily
MTPDAAVLERPATGAGSVGAVGRTPADGMLRAPSTIVGPDAESRAWLAELRDQGARGAEARGRLHDLLLRAARFEIKRRRDAHSHLRGGDLDDLAQQSADDALQAILTKLDQYRGESRFTTWAYKFALLEAGVKLRRRAWQGREIPVESDHLAQLADPGGSPVESAEARELLSAIATAIETELSPRQREVLVAVALNGVPIDVLAARMNSTRGALYKTIHDARRKLRADLARRGLEPGDDRAGEVDR